MVCSCEEFLVVTNVCVFVFEVVLTLDKLALDIDLSLVATKSYLSPFV